MTEPQERAAENPEVLQIKAQHKQAIALMESQRDADRLHGLPFSARLYFDEALFDRMNAMAERMASSKGMPKHIQGDPIMGLYCIERGWSWGMSPLAVAMGTFKIGEQIGHYGRIIIAAINSSGRLHGALQFSHFADLPSQLQVELDALRAEEPLVVHDPAKRQKIRERMAEIETKRRSWAAVTANFQERASTKKMDEHGNPVKYLVPAYTRADEEGLGVIITGHIKGEDDPRQLRFYLKQAFPRNSTLWATDPATQLCYTGARRFGSLYMPDIVAGARMEDDFEPPMRDITPLEQQQEGLAKLADPEPQPSKLSVIAARNAPPTPVADARGAQRVWRESTEPIPETAPGRAMTPPQDVGYSEAPTPEPPTEIAPSSQQSASLFEATIGGEVYHHPEDAALALTLRIETGDPGKILDEYADVIGTLPRKLANEVLAAAAARGNKNERKHADAERERQASAKTDRKQESKRRGRPSEAFKRVLNAINTATSQREIDGLLKSVEYMNLSATDKQWIDSAAAAKGVQDYSPSRTDDDPEPAATPAPGREDVEETEPQPAPATYYLVDTRGDPLREDLTAAAFLDELQRFVGEAGSPGEARAWKRRNQTALEHLIQTETDKALVEQAVSLRP